MLSDREILSTLEMLKNEHLDVRTVTLGINLFTCVSHSLKRLRSNIRKKIFTHAKNLVATCNAIEDKYGIPVVNKRIAVSPIAAVGAPFAADELVEVAKTLDAAAVEVDVDFIGGFSALVEKGLASGDRSLIHAIPKALCETERVCASVNVASTRAGINIDAVLMMGNVIRKTAELSSHRDGIGCAKLCVFANIPQDIPFMAGAYLGIGEAEAVINVGVSGPGVIKKAIDRALESNPRLDLGQLSDLIKKTAYKVTRVGELPGSDTQCRRQCRRNFSESGARRHRRSGNHGRPGSCDRRSQEGWGICQLQGRRIERRLHSGQRGSQYCRSSRFRLPEYREARGHDQRLLSGIGHDRHPRGYVGSVYRRHHRR